MDTTGRWRKVPAQDDTDWLMLPYGARGLYLQIWRKLDNDGRLHLGKHGLRGVCVHVGMVSDWPAIEPDLKVLLDSGEVTFDATTGDLCIPRFVAAQTQLDCPGKTHHQTRQYTTHRNAVFSRDGWECRYCGSKKTLSLDHVIPPRLGGGHDPSNLVAACRSCNSRKGSRTPAQAGMARHGLA